jgi:protein translocase SecG subunit
VHTFNILLSIGQVVLAIALIFIVDIQTTKNEGLGGTIGGTVQSSFKGKAGFEERLTDLTKKLGYGFFIVSILVALTMNR